MKQQSYPASKIRKGAVLYSVTAFTNTDGTRGVDVEEWIVRSIQKKRGSQTRFGHKRFTADIFNERYVNLVRKINGVTWVRLSRKQGDYGFSRSISSWFRSQFREGNRLPLGVYTTKLAACKYAIGEKTDSVKSLTVWVAEEDDPKEKAEWLDDLVDSKAELKLLKTRLKRLAKE